jgi:RNA polymerase-associated protein
MITLYDAPRCPFCARARIVLADKQVEYDTVIVDLDERPDWIVELNPPDGRVPVMEQPGMPLLPESRVIMGYVEERFAGPALLPQALEDRALVDLAFERFDGELSTPYYRYKSGRTGPEGLLASLARLDELLADQDFLVGDSYSLADIAYAPWIIRSELLLEVRIREHANLAAWMARLEERESIQAETEVVGSLVS